MYYYTNFLPILIDVKFVINEVRMQYGTAIICKSCMYYKTFLGNN